MGIFSLALPSGPPHPWERPREVSFLEDGGVGSAKYGRGSSIDESGKKSFNTKPLTTNRESAQKGGYRFFMEKEIYEQSRVIEDTLLGRVLDDEVYFEELDRTFLEDIESIRYALVGQVITLAWLGRIF